MQITFLGTGSSVAIPRENHDDPLCADARKKGSKSLRRRSSILVEEGGLNVLIDAGPDLLEQFAMAGVQQIDAVFLTHEHADAAGGLTLLNAWLANKNAVVPLYALPQTITAVLKKYSLKQFTPRPLSAGRHEQIGPLDFTPFSVWHGIKRDVPTLGYRFNDVIYASDMDGAPAESVKIMRDAKTAILDGTFWWKKKVIKGHFSIDEAVEFAKQINPKEVYLTQIGHNYPPHDEAVRELTHILKKQNTPFPVRLACDGSVISPSWAESFPQTRR
jgi:phosphoribosyl 1,2-cyclic phosphate phosphodiesterase